MNIKLTLKDKVLLCIAVLYSILILVLSLVNLNEVKIVKLEASDKIYHFVCYAFMSFLWSYFTKSTLKALKNRAIFVLIFSISVFGIIIEVLQLKLTDYRAFDWWDILANFVGAVFGIIIFKLFQKIFNH